MAFNMEVVKDVPGLEGRKAQGSKYDEILAAVEKLGDNEFVLIKTENEKEGTKLANAVRSLGRKRKKEVVTNQRGGEVFFSKKAVKAATPAA